VREPSGSGNGSGGSSGGGRAPAMAYDDHTDFISGLCEHTGASGGAGGATLLVTSGDGTLSVHDLRKRKALARSEDDADDEMLSVVTLKHSKKVVVGCQSGVLSVFSWGYWADCSDRFPGHPESGAFWGARARCVPWHLRARPFPGKCFP
jgi:ATP-dependent RNA helicase DOB1